MNDEPNSPARERVLRAAEQLFSERGYAAVTMRDIAAALNMRQASLYHHVPGGKEQLFLEVTERSLARHHVGLRQVIAAAEPELRAQLRAIAHWLISQPPVDLARIFRSDIHALPTSAAGRLFHTIVEAMFEPIKQVLEDAYQRGEIRLVDKQVLTVALLAVLEAMHDMQRYTTTPRDVLASDMVDLLLDGLRRR